ncbi:hypothetical protein ACFTAO_11950 [Paenibacillus rhizoplanae]
MSHLADRGSKRIAASNTGSWSAAELLPMAVLRNKESGSSLFWQIEHNGSWHWELTDQADQLTLLVSGPTEHDNHWWLKLAPRRSVHLRAGGRRCSRGRVRRGGRAAYRVPAADPQTE